jgi:hypothetical protein
MAHYHSVRELSIWVTSPAGFLKAALKGWLDDSDSKDKAFVLAGYVGSDSSWQNFEPKWQKVLSNYGLAYFHMKEMGARSGEFSTWPNKEDPEIIPIEADLLYDLAVSLNDSGLRGVGIVIPHNSLARFNVENGPILTSKRLAVFWLQIMLKQLYADDDVQIVLDRMSKAQDAIKFGEECFKRWFYKPSNYAFTALPEGGLRGAHNMPALQAADYLAGEMRLDYVNKQLFYEHTRRPI